MNTFDEEEKLKNCIICGKVKDQTFFDKSDYRPICSKECYYKWFDICYNAYKEVKEKNKERKLKRLGGNGRH